ncbi:MAG: hypothetical protein HY287_15810 [Planctomycetes bacterium]|nr:hypothetical protein [Planctomycetota bacterium]MBI3835792.1 hypothetical protein [Planctomycetota bacterium]
MKFWMAFVVLTILCWGAYVPTIQHGQRAFSSPTNSALRAFLFIGLAYFLMAAFILAYMVLTKPEPMEFSSSGVWISTIAGILGALGAIGIVFAHKNGGSPLIIAPLVFAGAPIINTIVAVIWDRPKEAPSLPFYAGIALACAGAAMALYFKPATMPHGPTPTQATSSR